MGVRVVDLSRVLAGPYATMLLADLGADVVKVERPGEGDETRGWGPPYSGDVAAYFLAVNRSKRSVALDLKQPEGRALALDLCTSADVVIENFRPGTAARLGLDAAAVHARNSRVVYCSITGFGEREPRDRPGYDFIVQGESGLMAITGGARRAADEGRRGARGRRDRAARAIGILAALRRRDLGGSGERIGISLLDSALAALVNVAQNALVSGEEPQRYGNAHPSIVPYEVFATADGWITVAAANDSLYRRLCDALEWPELAADQRFATNAARVRNREELLPLLRDAFLRRPSDDWVAALGAAGVPVGKIRGVLEALRAAAPATVQVTHPSVGELELVAPPFAFESAGLRSAEPPPLLGQHTREVLTELGIDEERLAGLLGRSVVATAET